MYVYYDHCFYLGIIDRGYLNKALIMERLLGLVT